MLCSHRNPLFEKRETICKLNKLLIIYIKIIKYIMRLALNETNLHLHYEHVLDFFKCFI